MKPLLTPFSFVLMTIVFSACTPNIILNFDKAVEVIKNNPEFEILNAILERGEKEGSEDLRKLINALNNDFINFAAPTDDAFQGSSFDQVLKQLGFATAEAFAAEAEIAMLELFLSQLFIIDEAFNGSGEHLNQKAVEGLIAANPEDAFALTYDGNSMVFSEVDGVFYSKVTLNGDLSRISFQDTSVVQ